MGKHRATGRNGDLLSLRALVEEAIDASFTQEERLRDLRLRRFRIRATLVLMGMETRGHRSLQEKTP